MIARDDLDHYRDFGFGRRGRPQPLLTAEAGRYREACERSCIEAGPKPSRRQAASRTKPYTSGGGLEPMGPFSGSN